LLFRIEVLPASAMMAIYGPPPACVDKNPHSNALFDLP